MAQIVLGMAVPHSGMLGKAPEVWLEDGLRDHRNQMLWFRNKHWMYEDLVEARKDHGIKAFLTLDERRSRAARTAKALDELRRVYEALTPDVAIIIGKDQKRFSSIPRRRSRSTRASNCPTVHRSVPCSHRTIR